MTSIPNEAVEAALSALFPDREAVSTFTRAVQVPVIRAVLEAAAPFISAEAWHRGYVAALDEKETK